MSWIESHQSLRLHPKLLRASNTLGLKRHLLIGYLMCLWWWGLDVADQDGWLPKGTTAKEIAEASEWPNHKTYERFVEVLISVEFLHRVDGLYRLHDWYDYAGKLNARRERNKEAMRAARGSHVDNTSAPRVKLPPQPTNQPNQPTNQTVPLREHALNLDAAEWAKLATEFPGINVGAFWKEWINWIEEEALRGRSKQPDNKYAAFKGFVSKKLSAPKATA